MKLRKFIKKYVITIVSSLVFTSTLVLYFISKDEWILLCGGFSLAVFVLFFINQRHQYEKVLERVTGNVDQIITNRPVNTDEPLSDHMSSKLSHQLSKLQKTVMAYNEKAQKDKEEIRELITDIAHQLRMPITNIDTYLQLLSTQGVDDDERKKYLDAINISKDKLIFLVENFIKMSRLERDLIQIRKKSNDINSTVNDEIIHIKDRATKRNISIDFSCKEELSVPHDKNWIGEAVFNLLDNSAKYSTEGSVINVTITKNDMFAEIRIEDRGVPLHKGEEHLIFKRFFRGSNVKDEEGFGLGLFLTREIILAHQGFVKFRNTENGHIFSIFLPA